jgi:formate hydrogenlyase subunit 3/multisubunit Na+/H+ antiporter MnhD subunit
LLYGCFSLLGLPLTPGFAAHWTALTSALNGTPWLAAVVFLSLACASFALGRALQTLFRSATSPSPIDPSLATRHLLPAESAATRWLVAVAMLLALLFTLFPSLLQQYANQLAAAF